MHSKELKVIGSLPAGLEGVFARTGPNPEQLAGDYHWCGRGVFVSELQGFFSTMYQPCMEGCCRMSACACLGFMLYK